MGNKGGKMKVTKGKGEKDGTEADKNKTEADENKAPEGDKAPEACAEASVDLDADKADAKPEEEKVSTEFRWEGEGESVEIGGSFNGWGDKIKLEKKDDVFTVSVDLKPGEYMYKYFVDGDWKINSNQPTKADDAGLENNVLTVTKG